MKWKDIKGYEGLYIISENGDVKSLPKEHRYGNKSEKTLKPRIHKKYGYAGVCLCKDGLVSYFRRARLVAQHFIPNPNNKEQVNHINGIKDDDRVENLEWVTPKENSQHAWDTGLSKISKNWINAMKKIDRKNVTNETKLKMRQARLGKPAWNKGMTKQQEYEYRMAKIN